MDDSDFDKRLRADVAKIEEYEKRSHEIKLTPKIDEADTAQARRVFQKLDQQITTDARRRGGVLGVLHGLFGRGGGTNAAAGAGGGFLSGIGSAAGPGILGIGAKPALIGAAVPVAASVLPAALGIGGTAIGGGLGLGVAGLLGMQAAKPAAALAGAREQAQQAMAAAVTPAQRAAAQAQLQSVNQQVAKLSPALHSIFTSISQIQTWWEKFTKSLAPMLAPALRQIVPMLTSLGPAIKSMFAGAMTVVVPFVRALTTGLKEIMPLLGQLFRASAPGFAVLTRGLLTLVKDILPGMITLVKATAPVMGMFAKTLGTLGSDLGKMFAVMAPAVKPSMIILDAILKAVGALLPVIGKFAAVAARLLAPVFVALAKVVQALIPILTPLLKIFAEFAGAALTDVVAVLGALATLLKDIAPSFAILAKVAGQVFRTLENSGVFQVLANALEKLAGPLAKMINALVRGLAPILPSVIKFIESLTAILTKGLVDAVIALLPPLTKLALVVIKALVDLLPVLLPLITELVSLLTPAVVSVIQGVADALSAIISAVPPKALEGIVLGIGGVFAAFKTVKAVNDAVGAVKKFVGETVIGSAKSAASAVKTAAVWTVQTGKMVAQWAIQAAKATASAAVQAAKWVAATAVIVAQFAIQAAAATAAFIAENAATLGIIAGIALLIGAIIFLATHWKQTWNVIKEVAKAVWDFLTHGWGQFLIPGLYLIRKVVEFVRDHWRQAWSAMKQAGQDLWQWLWNDFGAKILHFFTQTLPDAFTTAVKAIKIAWHAIQDAVATPVNWVITHVINNLIKAFDWISSKVGGPHIGLFGTIGGGGGGGGAPSASNMRAAGFARGGRLPGWGGPDQFPALLGPGETVVSAEDSRKPFMRAAFEAAGVPGYQQGGLAGARANLPSLQRATKRSGGWLGDLIGKVGDIGKITAAIFSGNTTALVNAISALTGGGVGGATADMAKLLTAVPRELIHDIAHFFVGLGGGANANAIVRYALSFLGKVPYVWGGASPSGWDCSGFVKYIYNHFGINPPRTADAQWGWVRRVGTPAPGGLVFGAGADGSAANPGHVGISIGRGRMVNAYTTGTNTIISPIMGSMGAVTGYGIPPGGFGGAGKGMAQRGSWTLPGLEGLWRSAGGPASRAHLAAAIALAESGGNPLARNASGASGLWQILGQVFPGNIMNPFINARNAVRKYYQAGGFSPWVTYTSGAWRQFYDNGGWLMPGGMNGTARPEAVLNPAQSDAFVRLAEAVHAAGRRGGSDGVERALERLISAVERNAAQTADGLAAVLDGTARKAVFASAYGVR